MYANCLAEAPTQFSLWLLQIKQNDLARKKIMFANPVHFI